MGIYGQQTKCLKGTIEGTKCNDNDNDGKISYEWHILGSSTPFQTVDTKLPHQI